MYKALIVLSSTDLGFMLLRACQLLWFQMQGWIVSITKSLIRFRILYFISAQPIGDCIHLKMHQLNSISLV